MEGRTFKGESRDWGRALSRPGMPSIAGNKRYWEQCMVGTDRPSEPSGRNHLDDTLISGLLRTLRK